MHGLFTIWGRFTARHRLIIIGLSILLVAISIGGALQVNRESGTATFVSTDSQVYEDYERFNQSFSSDVVVILVTADDTAQLLQPDNIRAMESLETGMALNPNVISVIGPISLIKQSLAQQGAPSAPTGDLSVVVAGMILDAQTGAVRQELRQVFPDSRHAAITVVMQGGMASSEKKAIIESAGAAVSHAGLAGASAVVTGQPVLDTEMEDMMATTMRTMIIVAVLLMLVVLAAVFTVRGFFTWRWLPLGVVLMAIVYTFGTMGASDIPLTMVTMAAFPILIGLGIDYAIQLYNRYDEESRGNAATGEAITRTVTSMGPVIGTALLVTCLSFAALFFSPVPMIQDFGKTLIIGVAAAYLVSMAVLAAVLCLKDRNRIGAPYSRREDAGAPEIGMQQRIFANLAPKIIGRPFFILPIALVLCGAGLVADSHIETKTDTIDFLSQDLPVIQDLRTLESVYGGRSSASLLIESDDVTDPAILRWMLETENRIRLEMGEVVSDTSSIARLLSQNNDGEIPDNPAQTKDILGDVPSLMLRNLVTDDWSAANLMIGIGSLEADQLEALISRLKEYTADAPIDAEISVTGSAVIRDRLVDGLTGGRVQMTLIGIGFVFLGLLVLFRLRLLRVLMAILPIALIIGWSSGVMYILGIEYSPITATLGALIIGIGLEFTIMLMSRYHEERDKGMPSASAMTAAMTSIGRAIFVSAVTTIAGFGALLIAFDFPILQEFGMVTMINVLFALISTLFVLPPLIVGIDSWQEKRGKA